MARSAFRTALALFALVLLALPVGPQPTHATTRQAQPISINILAPGVNENVANNLYIEAKITSTFEITSLIASVGTLTTTLTCCGGRFRDAHVGILALNGLTRGTQTLTVSVTDALGNSAQAQVGFTLDRPPTLNVVAPLDGTVLPGNQLDVRLSCTDDGPTGCTRVVVRTGCGDGSDLVSSTSSISQTISLISVLKEPLLFFDLCLRAIDSTGRKTDLVRRVFINQPPALLRQIDVVGEIVDADSTRLLVRRADPTALVIINRATSQETAVSGNLTDLYTARLTPDGVLYIIRPDTTLSSRLYQWRNGATSDLGLISNYDSLRVAGNYATWFDGEALYRRDLSAGVTATVAASGANNAQFALLLNGDVIYASNNNAIVRYNGSVNTVLIEAGGFTRNSPISDGVDLLYTRCLSQENCVIVQLKGGEERVISPLGGASDESYRVNNGWIVYTKPGNTSANQLWLRAPDGSERRISFLNQTNTIDALGSDGTLIWNDNSFVSRPGQSAIPIGRPNIPLRLFGSGPAWELALGRTLFRLPTDQLYLPLLNR